MGYFANGSEGDNYQASYCERCLHGGWTRDESGRVPVCAVWEAHLLHNYEECNNRNSVLHLLIPREGVRNLECRMFVADQPIPDPDPPV